MRTLLVFIYMKKVECQYYDKEKKEFVPEKKAKFYFNPLDKEKAKE